MDVGTTSLQRCFDVVCRLGNEDLNFSMTDISILHSGRCIYFLHDAFSLKYNMLAFTYARRMFSTFTYDIVCRLVNAVLITLLIIIILKIQYKDYVCTLWVGVTHLVTITGPYLALEFSPQFIYSPHEFIYQITHTLRLS